jgi:hypothetical protein
MVAKNSHNKPGRPNVLSPSTADRLRVELAIGCGLSATAVAQMLGISRRTFNRQFAVEIETGRARVMTEMALCLYRAARKGNGAAAKALLQFMERSVKPPQPVEVVTVDRWAGLAERVHSGDRRVLPESEISRLDS